MMKKFIAVDDNEFNNVLCRMSIELAMGDDVQINTFEKPEAGLDYIEMHYTQEPAPTILLLDINMPKMDGWEFLEKFNAFPESIKTQFAIYMVSSSVDPRDIAKAEANNLVRRFLSKPLEVETIEELAAE